MPSVSGAVKYGSQGAAIGTAIAPGIGTAIGGGVGFLAGLFGGGDDEEERQKRFKEFLGMLGKEKRRRQIEAFKQSSGQIQQATAGAARRARAGGKDAEDAIIPAATSGARVASENVRQSTAGIDQQIIDAHRDFADRPIEPNALDYLVQAGGAVGNYLQNDRLTEAIKGSGAGAAPTAGQGDVPNEVGNPYDNLITPGANKNDALAIPESGGFASNGGTAAGDISKHRKRDMSFNPLTDDNYLKSLYGMG